MNIKRSNIMCDKQRQALESIAFTEKWLEVHDLLEPIFDVEEFRRLADKEIYRDIYSQIKLYK